MECGGGNKKWHIEKETESKAINIDRLRLEVNNEAEIHKHSSSSDT
jgi:hypothetical protein